MSFPHSAPRAGYVLFVSIVLAACSGDSSAQPTGSDAAPAAQTRSVPTTPVTPSTVNSLPDFSSLVEKSGPAVVNVTVVQQAQPVGGRGEEDPFGDFFRRFGIPSPDF